MKHVLALMLACTCAFAQNIRDSKGTEFWLAFMPNDHTTSTSPSLIIYTTSETPTSGYVAATRRTGQVDTFGFTIANANDVVRINLQYGRYELIGATFNAAATADCERVMPCGIHIVAQDPISVYAASRESATTDAWLALPTDVLGTDHRVMSYFSDAQVDTVFGIPNPRAGYPSQFVVIASQDSTDVTIDLTVARTAVQNGARRTVRLDRGQVYLVQAYVTQRQQNDDLTGSRIRSTKPIAVISGHYRAQVPIIADGASRDMLVEQIPSVDTWGKSTIVVPPRPPQNVSYVSSSDRPVVRVLAAQDNTDVRINGTLVTTLAGGAYYQALLTAPIVVDASQPVLCAIIDRSTRRTTTVSRDGDPSMLVVPPTEQFLPSYTCISIEPVIVGQPVFVEHHLTLIVPIASALSVRVDGLPVPPPAPIAGSLYGFVHVAVSAGTHRIVCDNPFGIVAYGYGFAESYGYTGGMAFERLGQAKPILLVHDTSGNAGTRAAIAVTYQGVADSLSFWAYAPRSVELDITWNASMFVSDTSAVYFDRRMTDARHYAFDTLRAGDTVALIPGQIVLGDSAADSVRISNVRWFDATMAELPIGVDARNGSLVVLDLCTDPRSRLFDPYQSTSLSLRVYDGLGRCVLTSRNADIDDALLSLPRGAYFIVRSTAQRAVVEHRFVQ